METFNKSIEHVLSNRIDYISHKYVNDEVTSQVCEQLDMLSLTKAAYSILINYYPNLRLKGGQLALLLLNKNVTGDIDAEVEIPECVFGGWQSKGNISLEDTFGRTIPGDALLSRLDHVFRNEVNAVI